MTDVSDSISALRSLIAAVSVLALAITLAPLGDGADAATSGGQGDGEATTAQTNPIPIERLEGATRYQTAADIATSAYPASTDVVIASGEEFADALAGAALEGSIDAPVLLVPSDLVQGSIPTAITDAIDDMGATSATFLGGQNAISSDVEDHIVNNTTVTTTERVSGPTRFETAEQIASEVAGPQAGLVPDDVASQFGLTGDKAAFLATGLNWPDSMAGGPGAFAEQHPILLTTPDSLHPAADRGLQDFGADVVFILGGTAVVSEDVVNELDSQGYETVRLSGADRWETAREVADTFADDWGYGVDDVGLATGFEFADALAAAPYLGNPAPLVLTPTSQTHTVTADFFDARECDIETMHVFGGQAAVESGVADAYAQRDCEGPADTLSLTPQSVTNPVGETHTVTADLSRDDGSGVTDEQVRFAVYPAGGGSVITSSNEDVSGGQASFSYSSDSERDDLIVACTDTTTCVDGSDLDVDSVTGDPTNLIDDAPVDVAHKSWDAPEAEVLEVAPESATNPVDETHTVTATVRDQFDEPIDIADDVVFQVFRSLDGGTTWLPETSSSVSVGSEATGEASFSYTGPSVEAQDRIVACVPEVGETDCADVVLNVVDIITGSDLVDEADKEWVVDSSS